MQVKLDVLEKKLVTYLLSKGFNENEARTIAGPLVKAEAIGKKTHGINKIFLIDQAIAQREGKPEVVKDKFNYALIDAHKELGLLSADFASDILIEKAKQYDNATVAVVNSYYYTMASINAEKIARAGFVAMIFNNGGPATVTPYGGIDRIFGTNPIAIGIPTNDEPIVLDMATSERPWSEINLAKIEKTQLTDKAFLDKNGDFTTDPEEVSAIIPFGDSPKGYGLNFMTEILTGALVGAKMGLQSKNAYDLGFIFVALSPNMFGSEVEFNQQVAKLIEEVKNSQKKTGVEEIYLPGEKSNRAYKQALTQGFIEISDDTGQKLLEFLSGSDVKAENQMQD